MPERPLPTSDALFSPHIRKVVISCHPGLEKVLCQELKQLGVPHILSGASGFSKMEKKNTHKHEPPKRDHVLCLVGVEKFYIEKDLIKFLRKYLETNGQQMPQLLISVFSGEVSN